MREAQYGCAPSASPTTTAVGWASFDPWLDPAALGVACAGKSRWYSSAPSRGERVWRPAKGIMATQERSRPGFNNLQMARAGKGWDLIDCLLPAFFVSKEYIGIHIACSLCLLLVIRLQQVPTRLWRMGSASASAHKTLRLVGREIIRRKEKV